MAEMTYESENPGNGYIRVGLLIKYGWRFHDLFGAQTTLEHIYVMNAKRSSLGFGKYVHVYLEDWKLLKYSIGA